MVSRDIQEHYQAQKYKQQESSVTPPQKDASHCAKEVYKKFSGKDFNHLHNFAMFCRSLDHLKINNRLLRGKSLQAPNHLAFSSALA